MGYENEARFKILHEDTKAQRSIFNSVRAELVEAQFAKAALLQAQGERCLGIS